MQKALVLKAEQMQAAQMQGARMQAAQMREPQIPMLVWIFFCNGWLCLLIIVICG